MTSSYADIGFIFLRWINAGYSVQTRQNFCFDLHLRFHFFGTIINKDMRLLGRLIVFLTVYVSTFLFVAIWKFKAPQQNVAEFLNMKIMDELPQQRRLFKFDLKPWKINPDSPISPNLTLHQKDLRWSLVVFVKSHSSHSSRRLLARMSWASFEFIDGVRIETIFIVGKGDSITSQPDLVKENEKYGDLLQLNIEEQYTSIGFKTLAGMQYASTHFPQDWMYVSSDDDIMPDWVQLLEKFDEMRDFVSKSDENDESNCNYQGHLPIMCGFGCVINALPKREDDSKWYMTDSDYPLSTYPTYCFGGLYGMSVELASKLYELSRTLQFFWIDDVWITGFLRLKHFYTLNLKCGIDNVHLGLWSITEDEYSSTGDEHELLQQWTTYVSKIHNKKFIYANLQHKINERPSLPFEFRTWLEYVFFKPPPEKNKEDEL